MLSISLLLFLVVKLLESYANLCEFWVFDDSMPFFFAMLMEPKDVFLKNDPYFV